MYMVSPDGVTLLSNKELCKEESHAASNLNIVRSSMFACEAGVLPAPDAGTPLPTETRNDILKGLYYSILQNFNYSKVFNFKSKHFCWQ